MAALASETVRGVTILRQEPNGLHWRIDESSSTPLEYRLDEADLCRAQHEHDLVVEAHPDIHVLPWEVPLTISNRHVLHHLNRQSYRTVKAKLGQGLSGILQRLQQSAERNPRHFPAL